MKKGHDYFAILSFINYFVVLFRTNLKSKVCRLKGKSASLPKAEKSRLVNLPHPVLFSLALDPGGHRLQRALPRTLLNSNSPHLSQLTVPVLFLNVPSSHAAVRSDFEIEKYITHLGASLVQEYQSKWSKC